jgi:hypothetical protein
MTGCDRQASGAIELYFYDELDPAERTQMGNHLKSCAECRAALEELSVIRTALDSRPVVDAPRGGDWSAFMQRLDDTISFERQLGESGASYVDRQIAADRPAPTASSRKNIASYLAMAALLTLVTSGVAYVARSSNRGAPIAVPSQTAASEPAAASTPPMPETADSAAAAAFAALSEQHFERSKLVVLGLANKDAEHAREVDWAYERDLASHLLNDTRVYRQAAEARGLKTIAGVMSDLELVLLQTALADAPDADSLQQIQRLIHKRDLVTKMDAATVGTTGS